MLEPLILMTTFCAMILQRLRSSVRSALDDLSFETVLKMWSESSQPQLKHQRRLNSEMSMEMGFLVAAIITGLATAFLSCVLIIVLGRFFERCRLCCTCDNNVESAHRRPHNRGEDNDSVKRRTNPVETSANVTAAGSQESPFCEKPLDVHSAILPPLQDELVDDIGPDMACRELMAIEPKDSFNSLSHVSSMTDSLIETEDFLEQLSQIAESFAQLQNEGQIGDSFEIPCRSPSPDSSTSSRLKKDRPGMAEMKERVSEKARKELKASVVPVFDTPDLFMDERRETDESYPSDRDEFTPRIGSGNHEYIQLRGKQRIEHEEQMMQLEKLLSSIPFDQDGESAVTTLNLKFCIAGKGSRTRHVNFAPKITAAPLEHLGFEITDASGPSDYSVVSNVVSNSPLLGHVHSGDKLLQVNTKNMRGLSQKEVLSIIEKEMPHKPLRSPFLISLTLCSETNDGNVQEETDVDYVESLDQLDGHHSASAIEV